MSVSIVQNARGDMGLQSSNKQDEGGFIPVNINWIAGDTDKIAFVADRPYRVKAIRVRVEVAGTDAGAVTAVVKKAASGTAITSGVALHSGTINLKGTAATNQTITLSTTSTDLDIAAGTCLGIDFTGVTTAAVGTVTVTLNPS